MFSAHCRVCKCDFDVKAMGESALQSHSVGKILIENIKRQNKVFGDSNCVILCEIWTWFRHVLMY